MRIFILKPLVGIGGGEVSLLELAENCSSLGHDVSILFDTGEHKSSSIFNKHGDIFKRSGKMKNISCFSDESNTKEGVYEKISESDLVFVYRRHLFSEELTKAVNRAGRRIVYCPGIYPQHITGFAYDDHPHGQEVKVDKFIFNSRWTRDIHLGRLHDSRLMDDPILHKKIPASKFYTHRYEDKYLHLHPPMNLSFYLSKYEEKTKAESKKELGIPQEEISIGIFGRLIKSKNPQSAILMLRSLMKRSQKSEKYKLYFIGSGTLEKELKNSVIAQGIENRVSFCGMQSDPFSILRCMDLIFHSCEMESMSRSLRESMVFAKPIIAPNLAGNKELLNGELEKLLYSSPEEAVDITYKVAENQSLLDKYGTMSYKRIVSMENRSVKFLEDLINE